MELIQQRLSSFAQECACLNARSTARILTKFYDNCLAPTGLRVTQLSILVVVAMRTTIAITKLANALNLDRTTLTRNLSVLEAKGLVQVTSETDVRRKDVRLSVAGNAILEKALPLWEKAQRAVRREIDYDALMAQFRSIEQKEGMFV
jgi:DNA-binding MarR family transcriptional regulator